LAGVKNVETLQLTGGATASVAANLAFDTIDLDQGFATNTTETLTFGKGYTNATTVKVDVGDTVTNTAADTVLTITGDAASFDAADDTVITGSDKAGVTNSMIVTNGNVLGTTSATLDFQTDITNIDSLTILDWAFLTGNDLGIDLTSYGSAITIDASSLDAGEVVTFTGVSTKAITYTGGNGGDTVVLSSGADTITLGNGKNTITAGANITYEDTIVGGTSTDTMTATTPADVDFQNVTGVEVLAASTGATLGTFADAAGIRVITHDATNAVAATTMTSDIKILASAAQVDTWTGGLGNDELAFTSTGTLVAGDTLSGGGGTANFISISNDDDDAGTIGEATTATMDAVSKIQSVKIKDTATDNAIGDVTLIVTNIAYDQTSVTIDAADLDAGEDFTFDASAIAQTDEAFLVTGGSGNDIIISGNGKDTLTGGSGADTLDGNANADTLTGGAGADQFAFAAALTTTDSTAAATDTVTDFTTKVDDILLNLSTAAGTALTLSLTDKGDAASLSGGLSLLSGAKGEYFFAKDSSQFVMDLDGNGLIQSTDLIVNLPGLTSFDDADLNMNFTAATNTGINDNITGGDGNDVVIFSGTTGLEDGDVLDLDGGSNQVQIAATAAATVTIDMDDIANVLSFVTTGADGGNAATGQAQAVTFAAIAETTAQTVVYSAASITDDDDDVTITNSANSATTAFNLTGGAGDDKLVGSKGADTLTGGLGADTLTGGLGANSFVLTESASSADIAVIQGAVGSATKDTVTGFTDASDKIYLDMSTIEGANLIRASTTIDIVEIHDNNSPADANGTAAAVGHQVLTAAATAADAKNFFIMDMGTAKFTDADDAAEELEAGGTAALTFAGNIAADDGFFLAYENTTGGTNIAVVSFAAADNNSGTGNSAVTGANNLEAQDLVTLVGVADASTITAADVFLF
jgi:Ca2+-binding RTX toxin-like protein